MNKRIKELAEQAKCYADENNAHYLQNQHWIETFEEKFAELIVGECMKLNHEHFNDEDPYSIDSLYRQHFGFKE